MCSLLQWFGGILADYFSPYGGWGVVVDDLKETWVNHPEIYGDMILYLFLVAALFFLFKMFKTRL